MWVLSQEQAGRLTALHRRRDLARLGDELAVVFPQARARLGERWAEFVALGVQRGTACGFTHLLCLARYLATWVACGAEFDSRQTWASSILADDRRSQGAKAYQLCMLVVEQLRASPQAGQPSATEFAAALRALDQSLSSAGALASLLPRERIRLGDACDVDAIDLRLVDANWRQHYTAQGGPWRRVVCAPGVSSITLRHDPLADTAPVLPAQITLLTRGASAETAARLRIRLKAEHRCDAHVHPLVQALMPTGPRLLRGDLAADSTLSVHVETPPALPHIGEESSAQYTVLTVASCGLRSRGVPVGDLSTMLAAYDAAQHLMAFRHEPLPGWQLPADEPAAPPPARCRRECDGRDVDASAWARGLQELDEQLQQGLARLFTGWERESGVSGGQLAVETASLLAGSAGITWGWQERPEGIVAPPYMRMEGLFDLVACQLALRFGGVYARAGSRSQLTLTTSGSARLSGPWQRGPADAALFSAAARVQVQLRQTFELAVMPIADPGLAVLSRNGPLKGSIHGAVGLEQRPDGPGLRWFVRLAVEAVVAPLRIVDPLLGVQFIDQPLLPAGALVDWSMA